MSFLSGLANIGSMFLPGPAGAALGALGGLMGGQGNSGAREMGMSEEQRRLAVQAMLDGNRSYDDSIMKMDLTPDTAVNNLHKYADYYSGMQQKNAGANAAVNGMMRSTEPGVQLANQTQANNLAFSQEEGNIRNAAIQRQLGIQGQRVQNSNALASLYNNQGQGFAQQGMAMRQMDDANKMQGAQGIQGMLNDPKLGMSDWLQGRFKMPGKGVGVRQGGMQGPMQPAQSYTLPTLSFGNKPYGGLPRGY